MKRNLLLLTGIVFVIAVLASGGCNNPPEKNASDKAGIIAEDTKDDSTKVDVFLKAVEIDGSMHLEMYHEKKPECPVIDGLYTVVYGGYTVTWRKADNSIKEVTDIRPVDDPGKIFGNLRRDIGPDDFWELVIPDDPDPDTIKYEIDFTIREDKDTTYTIDPYLRIPKKVKE